MEIASASAAFRTGQGKSGCRWRASRGDGLAIVASELLDD